MKSTRLTALLEFRLRAIDGVEIITPAASHARGAQLSLFFPQNAKTRFERMLESGLVCDYREPGIVRLAPAPLFNTFDEVWKAAEIVRAAVR
jgi:kynureninase